MARAKHSNPYETRTTVSLILAIIGGLSMLVLIAGVFRHFDFTEFAATYVKGSLRFIGILVAFGVSVVCSAIGFFLALDCAGQKRNPKSALAWRSFFLHAVIGTITVCVMILFFFARDELVIVDTP